MIIQNKKGRKKLDMSDKNRKLPVAASIEIYIIEAIDELAHERGWSRPLAIRHLLKGLVDSLIKKDLIKKPWYTFDDLKINPTFGDFEKKDR